jgi:hypothetical protein
MQQASRGHFQLVVHCKPRANLQSELSGRVKVVTGERGDCGELTATSRPNREVTTQLAQFSNFSKTLEFFFFFFFEEASHLELMILLS